MDKKRTFMGVASVKGVNQTWQSSSDFRFGSDIT